jgi:CubicO group peptidase (beta-lactamase class C family)
MTVRDNFHGTIHPDFAAVRERLNKFAAQDPAYSAGLCVYHRGEMVIDMWWGPTFGPDDLLPIFSSSKGGAGIVIACLGRDGLLDLDEKVST